MIAALAGLLALALLFVGALITISSGRPVMVWVYLGTLLLSFVSSLWWSSRRPGPTPWPARVRRGMVSLCLALFAGAAVAFVGYGLASRPPAQQTVATILREHRADLDRLKDMVVADRLETVLRFGDSVSRPEQPLIFRSPTEAGLSEERAAEYKRLMKAVGSERLDIWPDGMVHASVAAWGAANSGFRMSLAWSAVEPTPLLPTIDGFPGSKPPGAPNHAFSRIDGSWYVYMIR